MTTAAAAQCITCGRVSTPRYFTETTGPYCIDCFPAPFPTLVVGDLPKGFGHEAMGRLAAKEKPE